MAAYLHEGRWVGGYETITKNNSATVCPTAYCKLCRAVIPVTNWACIDCARTGLTMDALKAFPYPVAQGIEFRAVAAWDEPNEPEFDTWLVTHRLRVIITRIRQEHNCE